ncbi:MAG: hypothetical protein V4606_03260 [Patescibacteria group bacterium]
MKTILIGVLFLIFIGGYFYINNTVTQQPEEVTEVMPGDTTVLPETAPTQSAPAQIAQFVNDDHDFGFKYRIKPYGYSVFENNTEQNTEQGTLFGVTLVRSDDYNESVKAAAEGNAYDGPPSINVSVYAAPLDTNLPSWLVTNSVRTNCQVGSVAPMMVVGEAGVGCVWDGLYAGETRAIQREDKIYVLMGTRENMETPDGYSYSKDFMDAIESFTFTE